MIALIRDIWYVIRCLFLKNPNHKEGPRWWNLKPGVKLTVKLYREPFDKWLITSRPYLVWRGFDGRPHFKIDAQNESGRLDKIYLADQGVVPYQRAGWIKSRTSYID